MIAALRSRLVAGILVLLTVLGSTGVWHTAGDDDVDFVTATGHDHSAHRERLSGATPAEMPAHCAICHWLHGFRTDSPPAGVVVTNQAFAGPVLELARRPRQLHVRVDVPSRAPPLS
jgi:hypothetical protein